MLGCNPIQSGFSRVLLFISGLCWFYPGRRTERCDEYSLGFLKQQKKKKKKEKEKNPKLLPKVDSEKAYIFQCTCRLIS